jgi:rod shape-determining protein MreC
MQRLINILLLFKEYILLVILIIVSLFLLSANDNSQLRAIRSYAVGAVGIAQNVLSVVPNIFELKSENEVLRQLDINLSNEVNLLREARLENIKLRSMLSLKERSPYTLVAADVVGKSLLLLRNTITLDAGESEGVKVDMPVISESGLVGKILVTSAHYSIGQIMLNKDFRASAKIQRSRIDGIIVWDGGDFLKLKNVAKTQDVQEGDVVITSEYSNIFPGNTRIGIVTKIRQKVGSLFQEVDVKPSVDFSSLEQVFILTTTHTTERDALEKKASSKK